MIIYIQHYRHNCNTSKTIKRNNFSSSELKTYLTKSQEVLTPIKCFELLQMINEEDLLLLWMENHLVMLLIH